MKNLLLVHIDGSLNAQWYIHEILAPVAIPFGMQAVGQGFLYLDDNALPHAAGIIQDYHNSHLDYTHMEWPLYSPDLNVIEYAWDMLGKAVGNVNPGPTTKKELLIQLQVEWAHIPQRTPPPLDANLCLNDPQPHTHTHIYCTYSKDVSLYIL